MAANKVAKNKSGSVKAGNTLFDKVKWGFIVLSIIAAVVGNIYYEQMLPSPIRAVIFILLMIVLLLVAVTTSSGKTGWRFLKDAREEMRKVAWPTRQETTQTTIMIVIVVLLTAFFLWIFDSLFVYLVRSILSI